MKENEDGERLVHLNPPQILYWLVKAKITVLLWGRGTGKTEGPGSMFCMDNMNTMPRSLGGIVSVTYDKLLQAIIPALVKGWEKFGYLENVHFFLRKYPPTGFYKLKPFNEPKKADHYIPWFTGAGASLISLDRPSTAVANSLDWMYYDEGRFMKRDRVGASSLAVRGNAAHFSQHSQHGSILITSDVPRDSLGGWLFDFLEEMDSKEVEKLLDLQKDILMIEEVYQRLNKKDQKLADRKIAEIEETVNSIRKDLVYVSFASTIDNIHALGLDVLKRMKRELTDLEWQVSVLSKRIKAAEKGFYALLDEDTHCYDAPNESFLDDFHPDYLRDNIEKDCRWDSDVDASMPLEIGLDYNFEISSMAIGQDKIGEFQTQNLLYVQHPLQLKDLVKKFARYYRHHPTKVVNYHYDHTALQGRNATNDTRYCDEVVKYLEEEGWQVNRNYFGQAMTHRSRYYLFARLFRHENKDLSVLTFNRSNTLKLRDVMKETPTKQRGDVFEKDKGSEKDKNLKPWQKTHLTEAWDMLMTGVFNSEFKYMSKFVETF